jgi:epoxyqueuosine reductase
MTERISRRRFLALAGAVSLGASPALASLDPTSLGGVAGVLPRPDWVRAAEHSKMRLDDGVYTRFDKRKCAFTTNSGGSLGVYVGPEAEQALLDAAKGATARLAGRAGFRPRDRALAAAARAVSSIYGGANTANRGLVSWTTSALGSEERFQAKEWSDPEEATRDVKIAARFFGAALVGITKLDQRHVYSYDLDGKSIAFENVQQPYEDDTHRVIPSSCETAVVFAIRMSSEAVKRAPTAIAMAATNLVYSQLAMLGSSLAAFIRSMGYIAIPCVNDTAASIPLAVDAGLGELARHDRLITPEYGPMVRLGKLFTNLPMVLDAPIDAGIREFCRSCAKCSEACPSGALSFASEPSFAVRGPWNNPGHEAWFEDSAKCSSYITGMGTNCMICFAVCPYSKKDKAAIHNIVKATISRTDALDGVIRSVDDAFGYGGQKSPDGWWDLDLPPFGLD